MHLFLSLCLALAPLFTWAAQAATPQSLRVPRSLAVKQGPRKLDRTLFYVQKGERLWVFQDMGEFTRIKIKRQGHWLQGYVSSAELYAPVAANSRKSADEWALGVAGVYSSLNQSGKIFETDDQVKYTLSKYSSQSLWPALVYQSARQDFWRVHLGYRITKFQGSATTDVANSTAKTVLVSHKMLSLAVDRAWTFGRFAFGGGVELSRALSMSVTLAGADLPTTSQDLPTYAGFSAFAGYELIARKKWSSYLNLRIGSFPNQQQAILALEAEAGALFWF